jgi:hypothetical protein
MRLSALLLAAALCAGSAPSHASELARADLLWARRAEGQMDAVARPERAREAVAAYEAVLAAAPENLEAHWKLQRALWFQADFGTADAVAERAIYERALVGAERAFAVLAARAGGADALARATPEALRARLPAADHHDAAALYFWHAINLGAWSRNAGLLAAMRAGVARRLHEATLRSLALDPDVEQGGALRLLSRLHSELPRVPLLSGFVDPERAVPLAERALAEYPQHPGNSYLLGLALWSHAPERRAEALRRIEATAALEPRSDHVVEDLAIREDALRRLREAGGPS